MTAAPDAGTHEGPREDAGTADAGGSDAGVSDAGVSDAGVSDAGPADMGAADSGRPVTYVDDVQPLLASHCASCHSEPGILYRPAFVTSYAALAATTSGFNGGCSYFGSDVQLSVGECIVETVLNQEEGSWGSNCNSWHPGQYHRDASWTCLTTAEIALVEAWGAGGMLER